MKTTLSTHTLMLREDESEENDVRKFQIHEYPLVYLVKLAFELATEK